MVFYTFKTNEYTRFENVLFAAPINMLFHNKFHFMIDIWKNENFNENDLKLFLNRYKIKGFKGLVYTDEKERINYDNDYYNGKLNLYFPFKEVGLYVRIQKFFYCLETESELNEDEKNELAKYLGLVDLIKEENEPIKLKFLYCDNSNKEQENIYINKDNIIKYYFF